MQLEKQLLAQIRNHDAPVTDVWIGLFWSAVGSRYIGMSHTFKTGHKVEIEHSGELSSFSAYQLAERLFSWEPLEASIGVAALNSLIEPKGTTGNIKDYIKESAQGKAVTIIGRFPFNDEITRIAGKTYILEIEPTGDELPMTACEEVVPESDINVITATALINHTLERLLELGSKGINIVLGPSTPLSPVLFDFGADILAGVRVYDKDLLVKSITQGVKKHKLLNGIESICLFKN
ncbi:MAG: hypothetical protein D4R67_12795 [Bacteroidetes bacterium]|nr:MAG: hypothetical protein D4R67_12795 [Bacteroidota bacterium]